MPVATRGAHELVVSSGAVGSGGGSAKLPASELLVGVGERLVLAVAMAWQLPPGALRIVWAPTWPCAKQQHATPFVV